MIHYIILRNGLILSKENYTDWQEIQDRYPDSYMASIDFDNKEELAGYFSDDFGDESEWPFSGIEIEKFLSSNKITVTKLR